MNEDEFDDLCHLLGLFAPSGSEDARRSGVALARTGAAEYDPAWDLNYVSPSLVAAQRQAFEMERIRLQDGHWPDSPGYAVTQEVFDRVMARHGIASQPAPPAPVPRSRRLKIRFKLNRRRLVQTAHTGLAAAAAQPLQQRRSASQGRGGAGHQDDVLREPPASPALLDLGYVLSLIHI